MLDLQKFRKVHHGDNWRSEVQDITIINKEEVGVILCKVYFEINVCLHCADFWAEETTSIQAPEEPETEFPYSNQNSYQ